MRLEDRALIADQVARYAQFWDRKDVEAFSKLFTEDAVIEWHFADATEQPPVLKGRENILQYGHQAQAGRLAGRQSRHHFSNLIFENLTETSALTEHMFMVTHVTPNDPPIVRSTGIYRIAWRKTDEVWLMSHRKLFVDRRAN
ncbi:MAG: nuclear transport factor 2 family protein [Pseudomonadota bacterium]